MGINYIKNQEVMGSPVLEDNNLKVKKAMAIELKKCTGLENEAIGRVLHLTPGEIDWIFNSREKEK